MKLTVTASIPRRVTASIGVMLPRTLKAELMVQTSERSAPAYTGDYTFTPDLIGKIFECKDKRMADNIVINPIPSNYGLITYNGFELTVS